MKRIITITILCLGAIAMFGQTMPALKVANTGNVGIGIDIPTQKLDVTGNVVTNSTALPSFFSQGAIAAYNPNANSSSGSGLYVNIPDNAGAFGGFAAGYASGTKWLFGLSKNIADATGLVFYEDALAANARLTIATGGNVGIGTSTPATLFEVNGIASKPGGGSWAVASDKRLKKNISNYTGGLKEILKFNPVNFQYNGKGGIKDTEANYVGLIAQEAQKVAPEIVSSIQRKTTKESGVGTEYREVVTNEEDYLLVDPSAIPYMLINSIKEQQSIIEAQNERISELENKLLAISSNNFKMDATLALDGQTNLQQNVPNPFTSETSINFSIDKSVAKAELVIYNIAGELIKTIDIKERGNGSVSIKAENINNGTYTYSLIADGNIVKTNKMIKAN